MPNCLPDSTTLVKPVTEWQLPWQFNLNVTEVAEAAGPLEIAGELGIGLVMMPLVANLQQLAIAKFYTRKYYTICGHCYSI
jgi:hypothetical protein